MAVQTCSAWFVMAVGLANENTCSAYLKKLGDFAAGMTLPHVFLLVGILYVVSSLHFSSLSQIVRFLDFMHTYSSQHGESHVYIKGIIFPQTAHFLMGVFFLACGCSSKTCLEMAFLCFAF